MKKYFIPYLCLLLTILLGSCRINNQMTSEKELSNIKKVLTTSNLDLALMSDVKNQQKKLTAGLSGIGEVNIQKRYTDTERDLAREFLSKMLLEMDLTSQKNSYETNKPSYDKPINLLKGSNLYSIVPATTQSDEYVILGAHFDTVEQSTGANDNATGCAMVYGLGMALTKLETRTKNIILVFFDQEERGLIGSIAFAEFLKQKEFNVHSVHTMDMIGWDQDGDRNIEIEKPSKELESIYLQAAAQFNIKAYKTGVTASDHKAFRDVGFNAIGITEEYKHRDTTPHYHQMTDKYETVDFDYLAHSTWVVFSVIQSIVSK